MNNFKIKFLEIMTCSKLQVSKTCLIFDLKGVPNQKKKSILKVKIGCFKTNESWHI